jgi:glutaredoxin
MTQICPKCNYVRKPTDEAPEWQCPSCQIAYVKASSDSSNAAHARITPIAIRQTPSSGNIKWIVIAVVLGAGLWIIKPAHHHHKAHVMSAAAAAQPAVILYGTTWCGYCAAARTFFKENDIKFTDMDVESSSQAYEEHKKLGGNGVPLIVIGDEVINGYSEEHMRQLLGPWL